MYWTGYKELREMVNMVMRGILAAMCMVWFMVNIMSGLLILFVCLLFVRVRTIIYNYRQAERKRKCIRCGRSISSCMGFVLARDIVQCLNENNINPREICGKCGVAFLLYDEQQLGEEIEKLVRYGNRSVA